MENMKFFVHSNTSYKFLITLFRSIP